MARNSGRKSTAEKTRATSKRRISSSGIAGGSAKRAKLPVSSRPPRGKAQASQDYESEDIENLSTEVSNEEVSEFEDAESPDLSADEDDDSNDDDFSTRKTPRSRQRVKGHEKEKEPGSTGSKKGKTGSRLSAKELAKPGVKAGLGPGTQVVIKKPKARDAGDTPYSDETIHPNTMLFLEDLAANNNRQWLKMHDPDYRAAQKDWASFVESLTQEIMSLDETIPELPVKDVVFRIYRDIRFSPDPTPYKTAFSAAWSRTGRKGPYAVYYVQIKPHGGSLVAGGVWMPDAAALAKIRRAIDRRPHLMKQSLLRAGLRKEFLGGVASSEEKVAMALAAANQENALKTKPKGFDPDHRDIELLRLRNFTLHRSMTDTEVLGPQGLNRISDLISCLVPFITYLNSVVMPDEDSESSSDEETEDEAEEGEEE